MYIASSIISKWITDSLIDKFKDITSFSTCDDFVKTELLQGITDVRARDKVETANLPRLCFVKSVPINWQNAEKEIFSSLSWERLQIGEPTEAEFILEDLFSETSVEETMKWLYKLFLDNSNNVLFLCTVIHAVSHLNYDDVYPYGPMMGMTMLSHIDKRVVFYTIKAFSNWNSKDSLKYVKNFAPRDEWAKKEWSRVEKYIEENGDEANGIFNENDNNTKMDAGTA